MEQLSEFFPSATEQQLRTALSLSGDNVSAAAQFLLNDDNNNNNDDSEEVGTITTTLAYNNNTDIDEDDDDSDNEAINESEHTSTINNPLFGIMSNSQQSSASIFSVASPPAILVNNIQSENNSQVNNAEADEERQVEQDSPLFTIGARIRYDDFYNSDLSDDDSDDDFTINNYLENYDNNRSNSMFAIPSGRRKKIYVQDDYKSEEEDEDNDNNQKNKKLYWVLFDNQIMKKTHIELLNVQLSKTSHKRVAILSQDATIVSKDEALLIFSRYFHGKWDNKKDVNYNRVQNERESMFLFHTKNNNRCNNKSNSGGKKIHDHGFWAQYFSVNDLNTMWRTLVAQTFFWGDRFVATVSAISVVEPTDGLVTDNRLTFDGAMYDTERGVRNAMERNCIIIVPCTVDNGEIYRHGVSLLSVQANTSTAPLYFQKCKLKQDNQKYIEKKMRKAAIIITNNMMENNNKVKIKIIEDYITKEEEHIHSSEYKIVKSKIENNLLIFSPGKTPSKFKKNNNNMMAHNNKRRRIEIRNYENNNSNNSNNDNNTSRKIDFKNGIIDDEDVKCEHCFFKLSGIVWIRET